MAACCLARLAAIQHSRAARPCICQPPAAAASSGSPVAAPQHARQALQGLPPPAAAGHPAAAFTAMAWQAVMSQRLLEGIQSSRTTGRQRPTTIGQATEAAPTPRAWNTGIKGTNQSGPGGRQEQWEGHWFDVQINGSREALVQRKGTRWDGLDGTVQGRCGSKARTSNGSKVVRGK